MALPGNVLSTSAAHEEFEPPRDVWKLPNNDLELGGVAISDASQGLQVKTWTAYISDDATQILVGAEDVADTVQVNDTDITEVSLTFDQQMRPFIAYVAGGIAKYRWFDPLLSSFTTVTLAAGSSSPRCCLDDKRPIGINTSDIILAYMRDDSLQMRMQRDRYLVEYTLASIPNRVLVQIGMNRGTRFQFQVRPS